MNKVTRVQTFKHYADVSPAVVATEIRADLQAGLLGFIKQMDVLQYQTLFAAWALWEKELVE